MCVCDARGKRHKNSGLLYDYLLSQCQLSGPQDIIGKERVYYVVVHGAGVCIRNKLKCGIEFF